MSSSSISSSSISSPSSSVFDDVITKHAEFYALDSASRTNGLNGVLRRIEIYSNVPPKVREADELSTSSSSSITSEILSDTDVFLAVAKFPFSYTGSKGPQVEMETAEFITVAKERVNLYSSKGIGADEHILGPDEGEEDKPDHLPRTPDDLPPGFEEVRKPNG